MDYVFRPGCEYNCYLARLTGAAAIPTLTRSKFRAACSYNCVHYWKPKPPPKPPSPTPVNPMNVYKYQYMIDKLGSKIESDCKKSSVETEYDDVMRGVLGVNRSTYCPARAVGSRFTSIRKQKSYITEVLNIRTCATRPISNSEPGFCYSNHAQKTNSKTACSLPNRGWHEEIAFLTKKNNELENSINLTEANHWREIDVKYEQIRMLGESSVVQDQNYRLNVFKSCELYKDTQARRMAKEEILQNELRKIREENEKDEKNIMMLRQYPRIGNTRAQLKINELEQQIEEQTQRTLKELNNPPFVANEIIQPKFMELPAPEMIVFMEKIVKESSENVGVLKRENEKISARNTQKKNEIRTVRQEMIDRKTSEIGYMSETELMQRLISRRFPKLQIQN